MRLYLDTEFNGFGGDLISMALISEPVQQHPMLRHLGDTTNRQFYSARLINGPINPWVKEHVMPVLEVTPLMPSLFKKEFHEWIRQFKNPEIVCDWHADAEHFCRLLAGEDYGSSLDFECRITILKTPPGQPVSLKPHNALADAEALMLWHTAKET